MRRGNQAIALQPIDLAELRRSVRRLQRAEKSESTWRTYNARWSAFCSWCEEAKLPSLPASAETLCLYITWALETRRNRLSTVDVTLVAILDHHRREGYPSPLTPEVREYFESCTRHLKEERRGKAPLTLEQLQMICALPCEKPYDKRNRAIILLGFASGWRRGELAGLDLRDVSFEEEGVVLQLRHSKTDQQGLGRQVGIRFGEHPETCPVRALQNWIEVRGEQPGPLFLQTRLGNLELSRMSGPHICRMVKQMLRRVGINPSAYGAHSMRTGFVTKAAELGASELAIMQHTGHRSIQTVLGYVRPVKAFRFNPIEKVL